MSGADEAVPWNFSWVVRGELCAMGRPRSPMELKYLASEGVRQLVTLSREQRPPRVSPPPFCTLIDVPEFEPPTLEQIKQFIHICEEARSKKEAVGLHCRMGRGRTGVMAACFLVKFYEQQPQRAVTNVRLMRPGSVETYSQERAVVDFYDYLRTVD